MIMPARKRSRSARMGRISRPLKKARMANRANTDMKQINCFISTNIHAKPVADGTNAFSHVCKLSHLVDCPVFAQYCKVYGRFRIKSMSVKILPIDPLQNRICYTTVDKNDCFDITSLEQALTNVSAMHHDMLATTRGITRVNSFRGSPQFKDFINTKNVGPAITDANNNVITASGAINLASIRSKLDDGAYASSIKFFMPVDHASTADQLSRCTVACTYSIEFSGADFR